MLYKILKKLSAIKWIAPLILFIPVMAQATVGRTFTNPLAGGKVDTESVGVPEIVGRIVSGALGITGILALVFIIVGGWQVIIGSQEGKEDKIDKGKKTLVYAIIGLLVAFAGYIVINIVLGRTAFLIGPVEVGGDVPK